MKQEVFFYQKGLSGEVRVNMFDYIFFDCMETLVDLKKLPALKDYAAWAYYGSGAEERWVDFDEFFRYYLLARQELSAKLPEYADYDMYTRFLHIVRLSMPDMPYEVMESTAADLYRNYWRNYKSGSFVRDDVLHALPQLMKRYKMGVVSNFMITGGIEEMLELHGIAGYFEFVVTSVAVGWIKPHPAIYKKALELANIAPEKVIFVGDDLMNDYTAPAEFGMLTVYLDRSGRHPELKRRVTDFKELEKMLL